MGNYMAFSGNNYYPAGGWDDFRGYAMTVADAKELCKGDWGHVVDVCASEVVAWYSESFNHWRGE